MARLWDLGSSSEVNKKGHRIMLEAGITSGEDLHPRHLWPSPKTKPAKVSIHAIKKRFVNGRTFYGGDDQRVTINDLPPGLVVILHAGPTTKVTLQITEIH